MLFYPHKSKPPPNKIESEDYLMDTFLDLLFVVVLTLAAVSLVAMVLMFLVKNRTVKRVCLYLVAALSIYMGYVGLRILWPGFPGQCIIAVLVALTGIGALALERLGRNSRKKFLLAQIMASLALITGMLNAFV